MAGVVLERGGYLRHLSLHTPSCSDEDSLELLSDSSASLSVETSEKHCKEAHLYRAGSSSFVPHRTPVAVLTTQSA